MTRTATWTALLACALALTGCFDSIVDAQCASGYTFDGVRCQRTPGGDAGAGADGATGIVADGSVGIDAGSTSDAPGGTGADAGVDGPIGMCSMDLTTDPLNCGACGNVCVSGVCVDSVCLGELSGHVVVIGHDYAQRHAAMNRLLGNSVALANVPGLTVARLPGAGSAAVGSALNAGLLLLGLSWTAAPMPATPSLNALDAIDVVVIEPQVGNGAAIEALGATWQAALARLLARGRVVIVLEGAASVSYRFALGAGLATLPTPVAVTGSLLTITDATDATTLNVVSPYFAATTSVSWPGASDGVVGTSAGAPVVLHLVR